MEKNFIYSRLVKENDDLIGMVAYGIYKRHKIEFIETVRKKHQREPNDQEWEAFAITANTDSQLEKYISESENIMADFVMSSAGEQINLTERKMLAEYKKNIKEALPSNWKSVWLSVLGSFVFSIIITIALFLGAYSEKGKSELIDKIIDDKVSEKVNVLADTVVAVEKKNTAE